MFLFTYFSNSVLDDLALSIDWRATSSSPPILFIEAPSLLHEISQCTLEIKKSQTKFGLIPASFTDSYMIFCCHSTTAIFQFIIKV